MIVDTKSCNLCGHCICYCPVSAIYISENISINRDECVECGVCSSEYVCPQKVFKIEECKWPRSLRAIFSNPGTEHKETQIAGRGTEEIKTNDVTNKYIGRKVGVSIELGRPNMGTRFYDVEKVTRTLAKYGVEFTKENPIYSLLTDTKKGSFPSEILNERVLSLIIEIIIDLDYFEVVFNELKKIAPDLDTVFSLNIGGVVDCDGEACYKDVLVKTQANTSNNAKINLGFGKLLKD